MPLKLLASVIVSLLAVLGAPLAPRAAEDRARLALRVGAAALAIAAIWSLGGCVADPAPKWTAYRAVEK